MKKFSNLGITTIVTNDKLKIEIPISGLVNGFNLSPNNGDEIKIKRGKRKEFAEYIARKIVKDEDLETGESFVMSMFEKAFEDVFEGNDYDEDIFKYPEEYGE